MVGMIDIPVREHHAPVGALRQVAPRGGGVLCCQGAPRTCRCIETDGVGVSVSVPVLVREHHAPVGALRHMACEMYRQTQMWSGSTTHL